MPYRDGPFISLDPSAMNWGNNPAMLAHVQAGMQYAIGDLKADDRPSKKK